MASSTPTDQPTFRSATTGEVPALVDLVQSAYRGDVSRTGWTTEADLLEGQRTDARGVTEAIQGPGSRVLVVEAGTELVACCHLERRDGYAYFGMFAVRPTRQGAGLGKIVLAEAERFARDEWHVGELHMTVISARPELIDWYVRRGYRRTGQMSPFPYGDERFGIPTRPDLEFELLVKKLG